jgi:sarcosine oxidase delta subunit
MEGKTPIPHIKCPHCSSDLTNVEFRMFGDGRVWLVGCPHCLKAVGANFEMNMPLGVEKPKEDTPHST